MTSAPDDRYGRVIRRAAFGLLGVLAIAVLVGSVLFGPAMLVLLLLIALIAVAIEPIFRQQDRRRAAVIARSIGATGPIQFWGRITAVEGRCPSGPTPEPGAEFVIAEGEVTPPLCEHARRAVLAEAEQMAHANSLPLEPVVYEDPDHRIELELRHEPNSIQNAA